jgi:hypothetical protein
LGQNTPIPVYKATKNDAKVNFAPQTQSQTKGGGQINIFRKGDYSIDDLNTYLYNNSKIDAFQSFSFQTFDHNNTYVNAEVASFLFGPVRMGVGGSFKTTGDSSKDNAMKSNLQNIISNNGAISFNFSLPLYFAFNEDASVHFGIFAQSNFGLTPNMQSASNYSTNVLFTNRSGLNFHFDVASSGDAKARISLDLPCTYVCGSQNTYSQLGVPDFSIIQIQAGVVITDLVSLHIAGPLYSTSKIVQTSPFTLYLQLSPSQMLKSVDKKQQFATQ